MLPKYSISFLFNPKQNRIVQAERLLYITVFDVVGALVMYETILNEHDDGNERQMRAGRIKCPMHFLGHSYNTVDPKMSDGSFRICSVATDRGVVTLVEGFTTVPDRNG